MKIGELKDRLDEAHVRPDSYALQATDANEAYVLRGSGNAWEAFYAERGYQNDLKRFGSEEDACRHFLDRVLGDPTTRQPL